MEIGRRPDLYDPDIYRRVLAFRKMLRPTDPSHIDKMAGWTAYVVRSFS